MNFQPTDYLNDLNLDFDRVSPSINESTSPNDLDLFSQSDFFDLDVFSKDYILPGKSQLNEPVVPVQAVEQPQAPQQEHLQPVVKQEAQDSPLSFLSLPSQQVENTFETQTPQLDAFQAANEDKRKRNTAASARFRIKKKMKEQQMEQQSRELQERVFFLEKKLKSLEMENKCLKNLILQKNEQKNSDLLENIKKRSIMDSKPVFQYTN